MRVNGADIHNYPLPRSPIVITYSFDFEEQEARIFAGMTLQEYDKLPGSSYWCDEDTPMSKSEVIAVYRLHKLINVVSDHANSKKGGRR